MIASYWTPSPEWQGQDAFIIGGGATLKGFDFSTLAGLNVIGINDAFHLGKDIVKYCIFGDITWFHKTIQKVAKSGIQTVSISDPRCPNSFPWLHHLKRVKTGFHTGDTLGWNYSTGACAINLAASLVAQRIYLLGFDLCQVSGKSHWHSFNHKTTGSASFERFQEGFKALAEGMKGRSTASVFNVTDGTSRLTSFQTCGIAEFRGLVAALRTPPRYEPHGGSSNELLGPSPACVEALA